MIGLMPYTGSVESYPTGVIKTWASSSYNSSTGDFTGNINTTNGKLYILIIACSNTTTTYSATTGGWTLAGKYYNFNIFYLIANSSTESIIAQRTAGTGTIVSPPFLIEVTNFKSATPLFGYNTGNVTSFNINTATLQKNSLVITMVYQASPKTITASGTPTPISVATDVVGTADVEIFISTKVPAGSYSYSISWPTATTTSYVSYAIR